MTMNFNLHEILSLDNVHSAKVEIKMAAALIDFQLSLNNCHQVC